MPEKTTIEITMETWSDLNALKTQPGETFDDVIQKLLADDDQPEEIVQNDREIIEDDEPVHEDVHELPPALEDALEEYREKCEHYDSERADARVRAARAIMDLLAESGGVGRKEATEKLLPEYAVEGQSEKTWWQRNGKDILGELDAVVWQSGRNEYVLR